MRTAQELFDTSVGALLAQDARSEIRDFTGTTCMYRGPNGLKYAVGHLLPDDLYLASMEGDSALTLLDDFEGISEHLLALDWPELTSKTFLRDMQKIHDGKEPQDWKQEFKTLSESYKLQWNFD